MLFFPAKAQVFQVDPSHVLDGLKCEQHLRKQVQMKNKPLARVTNAMNTFYSNY